MPVFSPQLLAHWTGGRWQGGSPAIVGGFGMDSRLICGEEMFVALKTGSRDGHEFLRDAKARGATAALVSEYRKEVKLPQLVVGDTLVALQQVAAAHRMGFQGAVIAVTGSCGKTSAKELLALLLGDAVTHRTPGNYNNQIGVPLSLLQLDPARHHHAVIEAGISAPGEMAVLGDMIRPEAALVTMVGPAHLEELGTVCAVAREKAALKDYVHPNGFFLFSDTCQPFKEFKNFDMDATVLVPGERAGSMISSVNVACHWTERENMRESVDYKDDYKVDDRERVVGGCRIILRQPPALDCAFHVPGQSPGMMNNTAMCILAALKMGVGVELVQERLLQWRPAHFRGEVLCDGGRRYYADCYNANPASYVDTLSAFDLLMEPELPRIFVLGGMGEMGPASGEWHRWVGNRVRLRTGDRALIFGEHAAEMAEGVVEGGNPRASVAVLESLEQAQAAIEAFEGAVLLKGSRMYGLEALLPDANGNGEQRRVRAC